MEKQNNMFHLSKSNIFSLIILIFIIITHVTFFVQDAIAFNGSGPILGGCFHLQDNKSNDGTLLLGWDWISLNEFPSSNYITFERVFKNEVSGLRFGSRLYLSILGIGLSAPFYYTDEKKFSFGVVPDVSLMLPFATSAENVVKLEFVSRWNLLFFKRVENSYELLIGLSIYFGESKKLTPSERLNTGTPVFSRYEFPSPRPINGN